MTDFLDSFDFDETNERYLIIKDQFGKECWYDPNTETMTPIDNAVMASYEPKRKIKLDDEPSLN